MQGIADLGYGCSGGMVCEGREKGLNTSSDAYAPWAA